MSAQPQLPSDIEGLARQVDPLSRRGFFMSSAAAAAAGYTLAAGPVRAQAITTDETGTGREQLFRNLAAFPVGSRFDIHFRVIDAATGAVVLTSGCYQYTISL